MSLVLSMQRSGQPEKTSPCAPQPNHPNPCRQCPKNGPLLPCQMFQVWTLYEPTFQGWCIKAAWKKIGAPSGSLFLFYTALALMLNLTNNSWVCALLSTLYYWSLPSTSPKVTPTWVWPIQTLFIELSAKKSTIAHLYPGLAIMNFVGTVSIEPLFFWNLQRKSQQKSQRKSQRADLPPSFWKDRPTDQFLVMHPPIPTVTDLYNGQTNQSINWGTPLLIVIRHAWTDRH